MKTNLSPLSLFSLRLDMMRNGLKIGSGTGFIYQPVGNNHRFLITNYHVISARDPKTPQMLLPKYPDSPDEIQFSVLTKPNYQPRVGSFSLIKSEDYTWIEHKDRAQGVDIVAIPIDFPNDAIILTQQDLKLVNDIKLEVSGELFIIGFPYGYGADDYLPIWKRATVASEPFYKPEGLPRFYIDSFTKPGMSGSPVFACESRDLLFVKGKTKTTFEQHERGEISDLDLIMNIEADQIANPVPTKHFQLVGIYSGKLSVHGDLDPNIGIVWHKELIDELFTNPRIVKHPYPPISF